MRMLVVVMFVVVTITQLVFRAVAATFYGMYQMLFAKEYQGTENVRLVNRDNPAFQLCQTLWLYARCQGLGHQNTVGRRLYAMHLQKTDTGRFVHNFFIFAYKVTN
jgi:hypothetical protein